MVVDLAAFDRRSSLCDDGAGPDHAHALPILVNSERQSGTVTFLLTDIEGSTRLWEQEPKRMSGALARHDALARSAVESHRGNVVKMTGDGMCAASMRSPRR
jgi:class 3 adenylate cyclase